MTLLARAKLSTRNRLLALHTVTAIQQLNFYCTKTTDFGQKTVQLTKPKTQKSSDSSSTFSRRVKKQTGALNVWPKPGEIPYQEKVANYVNLIGYVKTPVRFEAASDGKHFTAIVVSQENSGLLIPVVFEGDLAHVVAYHVKENDCVFVSGRLSVDSVRFALSQTLGKLHVAAENLNFVEGYERSVSGKKIGSEKNEEVISKVDGDEDFNKQWRDALKHAKLSFSGVKNDAGLGVYTESSGCPKLRTNGGTATLSVVESKPEKGDDKSAESPKNMKDGEDLWRDIVKNPRRWWDYRDHKSNGLVKEKFPDFKHKDTGEGLWVNTAPKWVLPGIEKLEFDIRFIKAKPVQGAEGSGGRRNESKGEDSWKDLVENPNKWWDNRAGKRYPKSPDFKHKETGEGLWLSQLPDWALSRLPPLKDGQKAVGGKKNPQALGSI